MGCWNATCFLSNLTIRHKNPVRLIVLKPRTYLESFHGPQDFWEPVGLPIKGIYDEYGSIEKPESGIHVNFLCRYFNQLKKKLVVSPRYSTFYGDKDFSSGILPLLSAIERNYLALPVRELPKNNKDDIEFNYDQAQQPKIHVFNTVMIHEELFQAAINSFTPNETKFIDEIRRDVEYAVHQRKTKKHLEELKADASIDELRQRILDLLEQSQKNYYERSDYEYVYHNSVLRYDFKAYLSEQEITPEDLESYIKTVSEFTLFEAFLANIHKPYVPAVGKGTQDNNIRLVKKLATAISQF